MLKVLIENLERLPKLIYDAETKYIEAVDKLRTEKLKLEFKECDLYKEGKINGKNELARKAEAWEHTKDIHENISKYEKDVNTKKSNLIFLKNSLETNLAIGKYISESDYENKKITPFKVKKY